MKTRITFSTFLLLSAFISYGQWLPKNSGTTHHLRSVFFTDTITGYAVGDSGTILKTSDGGENWINQVSGINEDLKSVFFTDENTGYIVGSGSIILKTINGGMNWLSQPAGISGNFNSVFFTNTDTGFIAGDYNAADTSAILILKTTNGGMLWSLNYIYGSSDDMGVYFNSVYFTDANTGYAVGSYSAVPLNVPYIRKTTNGGLDWTSQYAGVEGSLNSVFFTDPDTGYAVCGCYGSNMIKTIDGGVNWVDQSTGNLEFLSSVFFTDGATGYAVGNNYVNPPWGNIILHTTDGGIGWENQYTGATNTHLYSVYFTNASTGFAVGSDGIILKTSNGGTVGLREPEASHDPDNTMVSVYPNPSSGSFHIEYHDLNNPGLVVVNISNLLGQLIFTRILEKGEGDIHVDAPAGIYLLNITSGQSRHVELVTIK